MRPQLIPVPGYRDLPKAIDFLVEAFGFERHAVYEDERGNLQHVELVLGGAMVMPAPVDGTEYGRLLRAVDDAGPTGGYYVVVDDVAAHEERARSAGAQIVIPLREQEYGTDYTCRDLDGHLWTFGTYDPWASTGE
ncbi:VOC family protein [Egicoccus sp. AB-alg2]|uniref:VOC family protein n=1 Tax=Egicoccus sp. AB-alg2 TaxID=3242693 RepID=UPI00359E0E02